MSILQPITGHNPLGNPSCPGCNASLPPQAAFCSFCGARIEKKTEQGETHTENSEDDAQAQETDTVRLPSVVPMSQQKGELNLFKSNWLWPTIIILSAAAAGLINSVIPGTAIRPIIVMWFLFVCPGMVVVRFLRLKEPVVEWMLALALSFSIDAIVAGIQLYAGKWFPGGTLNILIGLCLDLAIVQLVILKFRL